MRGFSSLLLPLWATSLATLCQCYVAHPRPLPHSSLASSLSDISSNVEAKKIWQAPTTPTWIENLAIRSSTGGIIFSLVTAPEIYQLAKQDDGEEEQEASLLFQFPNVTSALGITEIARDVFAVVVGNFTMATASGVPGTYSLWKVGFSSGTDNKVIASKITDIPEAHFLNGITLLHHPATREEEEGKENLAPVLIADSTLGAVFKVNTNSGTYEQVLQTLQMQPPKNASIPIGINGLAVHKGSLYWTNTEREAVFSVPINPLTGFARPNATVRIVASELGIAVDDFAFDGDANLWIAGGNTLAVLPAAASKKTDIKPVVVVGSESSLTVAGSTSVRFADASSLYVTTDGGVAAPVNGSVVEAGKIVAVDLASWL